MEAISKVASSNTFKRYFLIDSHNASTRFIYVLKKTTSSINMRL